VESLQRENGALGLQTVQHWKKGGTVGAMALFGDGIVALYYRRHQLYQCARIKKRFLSVCSVFKSLFMHYGRSETEGFEAQKKA
jgi:hypothetical protein